MRLYRCHLGQAKIHKGEARKDKDEAIDQRRGTAVCQAEHYQAGDSLAIQAGDNAKGQQEYIHPRTNSHVPIRVQPKPNTEMKRKFLCARRSLAGGIHPRRQGTLCRTRNCCILSNTRISCWSAAVPKYLASTSTCCFSASPGR